MKKFATFTSPSSAEQARMVAALQLLDACPGLVAYMQDVQDVQYCYLNKRAAEELSTPAEEDTDHDDDDSDDNSDDDDQLDYRYEHHYSVPAATVAAGKDSTMISSTSILSTSAGSVSYSPVSSSSSASSSFAECCDNNKNNNSSVTCSMTTFGSDVTSMSLPPFPANTRDSEEKEDHLVRKFPILDDTGKVAWVGTLYFNIEKSNKTNHDHVATGTTKPQQSEEETIQQQQQCIFEQQEQLTRLQEELDATKRALHDQRRQMNDLIEHMNLGYMKCQVTFDADGNPVDWMYKQVNPAFEASTSLQAKDVIGKRVVTDNVIPNIIREPSTNNNTDAKELVTKFGNVAKYNQVISFEQSGRDEDGNYGIICEGKAYCSNHDMSNNEFVVLSLDVTKWCKLQEAFIESEERHRNLFESMVQGVVYQDGQTGNIIAANSSATRILGLTIDQMMGRTSIDSRWKATQEDGSDFPGELHPSMRAIETGQPHCNVTMGIFHPELNQHRWIKVDAVPRFKQHQKGRRSSDTENNTSSSGGGGSGGKPYQVYATFTDITDTKTIELKLRRAKKKAEEADQLKSTFLANMSHEIRTPLNGIVGNIDLALENDLSMDCRDENLDGLLCARTSSGLLISIIEDILDLSKIEAGQMPMQFGVFHLPQVIRHAEKLGQSLISAKKKSIRIQHSILSGNNDDQDSHISEHFYSDPLRLQQVLNNLISNAVKFTDQGTVRIEVRRIRKKKKNEKQAIIHDSCDTNRESSDPTTTTASCKSEEETVDLLEFCVRDTGKGIPDEKLELIFEPFRQVEFGDTRKHGGTGLGLTISKKLVQLMGGDLRVESSCIDDDQKNHGSAFTFSLPYRCEGEQIDDFCKLPQSFADSTLSLSTLTASSSSPSAETATCNSSSSNIELGVNNNKNCTKKTVLIVEDDLVSRRLVTRMVQKAGYNVLLAENGKEGVETYKANRFIDLILTDVQMPVMGGEEAAELIRKIESSKDKNNDDEEGSSSSCSRQQQSWDEHRKPIPIIALSAGAMKGDRERSMASGMTDYLTKPVNYRLLLQTLDQYLRL